MKHHDIQFDQPKPGKNNIKQLYIYLLLLLQKTMRRLVLVPSILPALTEKPEHFDIPKCNNQDQFFTLHSSRRKKKANQLACSMTISHFKSQSSLMKKRDRFQAFTQKKLSINDALTTVTDSSSNAENPICFKNKQMRQKVNKVQSAENLKNASDFWKKRACSPRSPVINWPKPKSQFIEKKKWTINDFHIIRKIGQGSYSKVFLAVQKATNFICSLKSLDKKSIRSQKLLQVVIRQLKIHHYLQHRNIVALYGQFDDEENIYLVMQYCTGGDLHKYMKEKQRTGEEIDVYEVSQFVKEICEAVATMHRDYLMHRDIKPENVFLTMGKFIKLGDFGWSVYYGDHALRNTQCGTPLYLAPQLVEQNEYSETVDIWAIGVLTYQLLTGQIPFKIRGAKDMAKILNQSIHFEYIDNDVARDFVMKLLQRDVKLRMEIQDVLQHPFLMMGEINE